MPDQSKLIQVCDWSIAENPACSLLQYELEHPKTIKYGPNTPM